MKRREPFLLARQAGLLPLGVSGGVPPIDAGHRAVESGRLALIESAGLGGGEERRPVQRFVGDFCRRLVAGVEGALALVLGEDGEGIEKSSVLADGDLVGGNAEGGELLLTAVGRGMGAGGHGDGAGQARPRRRGGSRGPHFEGEEDDRGEDDNRRDGDERDRLLFRAGGLEQRKRIGELVLDLHAEIPRLAPVDRRLQPFAAHPAEKSEHAGGSGLARGDKWNKGIPQMDDVAHGILRRADSGDGEIFQANDAMLIQMDGLQPQRRRGVTEGLVLHVRLGHPPQNMGEAGGRKHFPGGRRRGEGLAGQ